MKILFLHGWNSVPGGVKPTHLKSHGHDVLNPALPDNNFAEAVGIAQAAFDEHQPDVVVGSSRGGAVAMNIATGAARLVLICPAWRKFGSARTAKPGTTVLHSRADDVVPFADSVELIAASSLPEAALIEVGSDHRLADPASLAAMLKACEGPLDIENADAFHRYLVRAGLAKGEALAIAVLPGGVSSRTVLVEWPDGRGCVFKQALSKLRVAVDWFSDPVRVHREALGLRTLAILAPEGTVPAAVLEDFENHVVGMEAVPRPHENWKSMLLAGRLDLDHVRQFGCWLGRVHRHSWQQREALASAFDDRTFFESLRIEPYYQYAASQVPEAAEFLEALIVSTRSRRLALVHGDFSPKNVLVHAGRLVVLDFEVIHWGDPAFDIGFGLTHLLSKSHHVRGLRSEFGHAAAMFFDAYMDELGDMPWAEDVEAHAVRHALGCLLARVAGRSPLEYLDDEERWRQRAAVVALMAQLPKCVDDLVAAFLAQLD